MDSKDWIVNISNKSIPKEVLNFLSLGDKFALPVSNGNKSDYVGVILNFIKNFESRCLKLHSSIINDIRKFMVEVLSGFLKRTNHIKFVDKYVSTLFKKCKKYLRDNKDLMVRRVDKGQVTVIMEKSNYFKKMTDLLNDNTTYKKLDKDPNRRIMIRFNDLVKSWLNLGIIDEFVYKQLHMTTCTLPRSYGLPKIHKSGVPLRIIVSSIGAPTYNTVQYLLKILSDFIPKPKSHIKDSWTFVRKIKDLKVSNNQVLVSLDVVSLFPNIPKDLVMKGIRSRWHYISQFTKFSLD
ncbi:uncharacterized protein LOC113562139 [Ooceraea biroi]|uniref:uncharacterized protein LOC113562139 n=1 Tax=Ooceraea biroi TaxID=2015173 RepID=UPI000F07A423|nr:uncharacterized protein LOC113562139 [Ooceraea biroi]